MDKRAQAIRCFVAAMKQPRKWTGAWMRRGLKLWAEATGEDVSASLAHYPAKGLDVSRRKQAKVLRKVRRKQMVEHMNSSALQRMQEYYRWATYMGYEPY